MTIIMKFFKTIFNLTLLVFFTISSAEARWCRYEDAPVEIKFCNNDININKDGTYEVIVEFQIKILTESGRSNFVPYNLVYNGDSSHLAILEAKTIHNGKEYIVTKDMIEDKPLASSSKAFDQLKQVTISFPKIEIGSSIYLRYKRIEKKVPIDHFYSSNFLYGQGGYWLADSTKINSKLPLKIKMNDPRNVLKVIEEKRNNVHYINITLEKAIYESLVNEPDNGILSNNMATWVSLSSLSKWEDLAKRLAPGYYNVINQPLPVTFMTIAESAANENADEEKINIVTSSLNEKIKYMGDWRTISGRYFPRDLNKIANSQIGDCKDFSASAAAILQTLGYKVQPILVMRGIFNISNSEALPTMNNFNHVMLRVTNKSGKIYWIDPTNTVSMAQGIFPDIANKIALLLDPEEAGYIKIPDIQAQNAKSISHSELIIQDDIMDRYGKIVIQGESALNLTGAGLHHSDEHLKDLAFRVISGAHLDKEEKKFLELPDLTSRNVKDLTIKYRFQQKDKIFKTNIGPALALELNDVPNGVVDTAPDQLSDIFIGTPQTNETHIVIKNITIKNCESFNFEISSPWLYVKRSCEYRNNGIEFSGIVSIRKSFITNEELKTSEYKDLKNKLENNFFRVATVILNE